MNILTAWKGLTTASKTLKEHDLQKEYRFCYRCGCNILYVGGATITDSKGRKRWVCDFHAKWNQKGKRKAK